MKGKGKWLIAGAVGLTAALMAACHDTPSASGSTAPPSQGLDTARVLALAESTSETASPIAVNGGALTLTDTSDVSYPLLFSVM